MQRLSSASQSQSPSEQRKESRVPPTFPHSLKIAWLGPQAGALAWLAERLSASVSTGNFQTFRAPSLPVNGIQGGAGGQSPQALFDELVASQFNRLVLACPTRIDYPFTWIKALQADYPDLPFAVATDSWWDGSRRTGIGESGHTLLPWYRWWDGWFEWISGENPAISSPLPHPSEPYLPTSRIPRLEQAPAGMIVSNCQATGEAWSMAAQQLGAPARRLSLRSFQQRHASAALQTGAAPPTADIRWVLWDDSCLNLGDDEHDALGEFFQLTVANYPEAVPIAAFSLPRIETWKIAQSAGARELLAKPNTGRGLQRALQACCVGQLNSPSKAG